MITLILCVYNMTREVPRTLYTLSRNYQENVKGEYEVIVVENGSSEKLIKEEVESFGPEFKYIYFDEGKVSPVFAMNYAASQSKGDVICIMNDGARMLSPGMVNMAEIAFQAYPNAVLTPLSWHLGPKVQMLSIQEGYCQEVEDKLLDSVPWKKNGYSLFNISVLAGSSRKGWFITPGESNCIFMPRNIFDDLGGLEERFTSPGGGLIALDFFKNVWMHPDVEPVTMLGEGTFHQVHGGIATNAPRSEKQARIQLMNKEYESIRGEKYTPPKRSSTFIGKLPKEAYPFLKISANQLPT